MTLSHFLTGVVGSSVVEAYILSRLIAWVSLLFCAMKEKKNDGQGSNQE